MANKTEELWAGEFGNEYIDRNSEEKDVRGMFWNEFLTKYPVRSVLEVGCNIGLNLKHLPSPCGIDINDKAIKFCRSNVPIALVIKAPAENIPFIDGLVDLAFTMGVLIHQPEESLEKIMREIYRCSKRYILAIEIYAPQFTEIPYRGKKQSMFKADYGSMYKKLFPDLKLIESAKHSLWEKGGHYWLFEKVKDTNR